MNIFEQATRARFRFRSTNGWVSTEDLWTLSLEQLDSIAKEIHSELRGSAEESFISETKTDATLQSRFEVVKHIIDSKLAERKIKAEEKERKAQRQVLLAALEERQRAELNTLSAEELQQRIAALDKDAA